MNSTMILLKPLNNPNLLLPYEQYCIQSLHHEGKLIPEQNPGKKKPYSKRSLTPNTHIPLEQTSSATACIHIPQHHNATPTHIEPGMCRHQNLCRKHFQKHNTHKENSITIRHSTNQHLQKHAFSNNHAHRD